MQSALHAPAAAPKTIVWTARIIKTLTVLFLLFDVFGKLSKPAPVVQAFAQAGVPISLAPVIGLLLLTLVIVYLIPRANIFGAILLTGYLGGAVATNLRAGFPAFEVLFPIVFGVLIWAPLYLRDERLRALIPLNR